MSYHWSQYPQQGGYQVTASVHGYVQQTAAPSQGGYPLAPQPIAQHFPQQYQQQGANANPAATYPSQPQQAPYISPASAVQGAHPQQGPYHQQAPYQQNTYPPQAPYPQQSQYPQQGAWNGYQNGHQHGAYTGVQSAQQGYPTQHGLVTANHQHYPNQAWNGYYQQNGYGPQPPQAHPQAAPYPQPIAQSVAPQPAAATSPAGQPGTNSCYNCGNPSHWAQDCPEPRRAIPHGQMANRQSNPAKRYRPHYMPPVITKYPLPPHLAKPPSGPYTSGAALTSGAQAPVAFHADATPASHKGHPLGPSPSTPNNLHQPSFDQPYAPAMNQGDAPTSSIPKAPPQAQQAPSNKSEAGSRRPSLDESVSMASLSEADEDEEDYLDLDIPDLPQSHGEIVARPPVPLVYPLTPFPVEGEAPQLVQPPASNDGKIRSKYINTQLEHPTTAIFQELSDLDERLEDPIFAEIRFEPSREPSPATTNPGQTPETMKAADGNYTPDPKRQRRSSTPIYKDEEQPSKALQDEYDPFDPLSEPPLPTKLETVATTNNSNGRVQPFPPPPPPRQATWSYSQHTPSPKKENGYVPARRHSSNNYNSSNGYHNETESPPEGHMYKKRKHEGMEDRAGRTSDRRQYDDYTPKLKRNQPRVAPVYSRRW